MKKLYIALLAAALTLPAMAQEMNSAYFVDGYKYRHRLNPALAPTRSYFSLPALGGISANVRSDMGMKTFLYPYENGQLTTFMNGSVSSEEFLSQLKRNNDLNVNANLNLLSIGVWGEERFHLRRAQPQDRSAGQSALRTLRLHEECRSQPVI